MKNRLFAIGLLLSMLLCVMACGSNDDGNGLINMTTEQGEEYQAIVWGNKKYVPFCAISPRMRGKQIGFVENDKNDKIYEYKNYSYDEWIINYLNSDSSMLFREINVTNIPNGLVSEYEWNN